MRVLILGGCGFVGRHFAKKLVDDGNDIVVVDDLSAGINPNDWAFKAKEADVCAFVFSRESAREFFRWAQPDNWGLIIHCAAVVGGRLKIEGDPLAVAVDLAIDADFFNWVVKGKKPKKVVYFSSSAVYPIELQRRDYFVLGESLINFDSFKLGIPDMTYGFAKLSGEYLAQFAAKQYGLDVVIYRPFSGYGEDQSTNYPFPSIIKRVVNCEDPLIVWGSGRQVRDFIHIDDVVEGVLTTMNKLKPGEVLNLGSGVGTSFEELALMAAAESSDSPQILTYTPQLQFDTSKPEGVFGRVADTYKLAKLYQPKVSLEEGIRRSLAFQALDRKPEQV